MNNANCAENSVCYIDDIQFEYSEEDNGKITKPNYKIHVSPVYNPGTVVTMGSNLLYAILAAMKTVREDSDGGISIRIKDKNNGDFAKVERYHVMLDIEDIKINIGNTSDNEKEIESFLIPKCKECGELIVEFEEFKNIGLDEMICPECGAMA